MATTLPSHRGGVCGGVMATTLELKRARQVVLLGRLEQEVTFTTIEQCTPLGFDSEVLGMDLAKQGNIDGAIAQAEATKKCLLERDGILAKRSAGRAAYAVGHYHRLKGSRVVSSTEVVVDDPEAMKNAIRLFWEAVSLDETLHDETQEWIGRVYRDLGDDIKAAEAYIKAIQRKPVLSVILDIGGCYERLGWTMEAAKTFRTACQNFPESYHAHHRLGTCLAFAQDHSGAVDAFRTCVCILPNSANAHACLALALKRAHCFMDALTAFWKALDLDRSLAVAYYHSSLILLFEVAGATRNNGNLELDTDLRFPPALVPTQKSNDLRRDAFYAAATGFRWCLHYDPDHRGCKKILLQLKAAPPDLLPPDIFNANPLSLQSRQVSFTSDDVDRVDRSSRDSLIVPNDFLQPSSPWIMGETKTSPSLTSCPLPWE